MGDTPLIPVSSVPGLAWPAIPGAAASTMLAVQYQLEKSQWWPPEVIQAQQFRQLNALLVHAFETVPFHRKRLLSAGIDPRTGVDRGSFSRISLLRRADIQESGAEMLSGSVPKGHGKLIEHRTSGSTGMPIKAFGTGLTQFFWNAMTLREHLWHRRDLTGKLASIRTKVSEGRAAGWGPSTDVAFRTGPLATLNIRTDVEAQLKWLINEDPDYLISHPSNIQAIASLSMACGIRPERLKEVRTFGEAVGPELRELCMRAWGVRVVDVYSAQEVGYIALECPLSGDYHVQSEAVLVEILGEDGLACAPGETGRVVITTLHNYAMPLIRYEILDYAVAGGECRCGRGLPVIKRVLGRKRNMVTLPDGSRHWPSFPAEAWAGIAPIRQIQLVQRAPDHIAVRLVSGRRLSPGEEHELSEALRKSLGHPFRMTLEYEESIGRGANFKYEDFVSEIDA